MVVGILNTFAALARATVLFFSVWRSMDCTPNAICGWWSMKMTCEFCGIRTSSFGLGMGDPLRLMALDSGLLSRPKCAMKGLLDISPRWGTRCVDFGGAVGAQRPAKHERRWRQSWSLRQIRGG